MSYKHAWDLVDKMNQLSGKALVSGQAGGRRGGSAQLIPIGLAVIGRFRAIERAASNAAASHLAALQAELASD